MLLRHPHPRPRRFALLRALGLGCALAAALPCLGAGVLNIVNWPDYVAPQTLTNFEKEFGVRLHYDTFDSNETLFAKMAAGRTGYDLIVPSASWAALNIRAGQLHKLDRKLLPLWKNLNAPLMAILAKIDPGNQYLLPWMWGYTTVGINLGRVRTALRGLPLPQNPWSLLFDPRYAERLQSCGIAYLDSGQDIAEAALIYLGIEVARATPEDFAHAWKQLATIRASVRVFQSAGQIDELARGSLCAVLGWSGDIAIAAERARAAGTAEEIRVLPPAAGAMVMIDTLAIPVGAENAANAHAFLNYRLRPAVAAADTNQVRYANPLPASRAFVAADIAANTAIFLTPALMKKLQPPRLYSRAERRAITRAYVRFKTGN